MLLVFPALANIAISTANNSHRQETTDTSVRALKPAPTSRPHQHYYWRAEQGAEQLSDQPVNQVLEHLLPPRNRLRVELLCCGHMRKLF